MSSEQIIVCLGCFGRIDDGFVSCSAIENTILTLDNSLQDLEKVCQYLETLRLFDKPLFDLNAIRHCIHNMQQRFDQGSRPLWTEKQYNLFEKFVLNHRHCGLYIKLKTIKPEPEIKPSPPEEQRIFIPKTESLSKSAIFRTIKGKRQ